MVGTIRGQEQSLVQQLDAEDPTARTQALRAVRNAVIGNKTKKAQMLDLGAVDKLVALCQRGDLSSTELAQACTTLGSFALGSPATVSALLSKGAIEPLLAGIQHAEVQVVQACLRALKFVYSHAQAPRDALFRPGVPQRLQTLLSAPTDVLVELVASLVARAVDSPARQAALVEAGFVQPLLGLLTEASFPRSQEAALDALTALMLNNVKVAGLVADHRGAMAAVMRLLRDRQGQMRLLACRCIAYFATTDKRFTIQVENELSVLVLPVLVKLFYEPDDVREQVPFVLAHLIGNNSEIQNAACEADTVTQLADMLSDADSSETMREGALRAVAAIASELESARRLVVDARIIPHIVKALAPDQAVGVQVAACMAARSLSRSVKTLRTALADAKVDEPLIRLMDDGVDTQVQTIALSALCNFVLDFAPSKERLLAAKFVDTLVRLTSSMCEDLRVHSMWALKNLLYNASRETKTEFLEKMSISGFFDLLDDSDLSVKTSAVACLRNLIHGNNVTDLLLQEKDRLFAALSTMLQHSSTDIVLQALYVVCNFSTGSEEHRDSLIRPEMIEMLQRFVAHQHPDIRKAAIWCVINLTTEESPGHTVRRAQLAEHGVAMTLRDMRVEKDDLDLNDRLKTALSQLQ